MNEFEKWKNEAIFEISTMFENVKSKRLRNELLKLIKEIHYCRKEELANIYYYVSIISDKYNFSEISRILPDENRLYNILFEVDKDEK